jgi:hypothetical protein
MMLVSAGNASRRLMVSLERKKKEVSMLDYNAAKEQKAVIT